MDNLLAMNELKHRCQLLDVLGGLWLIEVLVGVLQQGIEELPILCKLQDEVD